jgi:hypothetical protein
MDNCGWSRMDTGDWKFEGNRNLIGCIHCRLTGDSYWTVVESYRILLGYIRWVLTAYND